MPGRGEGSRPRAGPAAARSLAARAGGAGDGLAGRDRDRGGAEPAEASAPGGTASLPAIAAGPGHATGFRGRSAGPPPTRGRGSDGDLAAGPGASYSPTPFWQRNANTSWC